MRMDMYTNEDTHKHAILLAPSPPEAVPLVSAFPAALNGQPVPGRENCVCLLLPLASPFATISH